MCSVQKNSKAQAEEVVEWHYATIERTALKTPSQGEVSRGDVFVIDSSLSYTFIGVPPCVVGCIGSRFDTPVSM